MTTPKFFGVQFKYLAKSLKDCRPEEGTHDYALWEKIVRTVAHDLSRTNENFNKAAFFRVSGLKKGGK